MTTDELARAGMAWAAAHPWPAVVVFVAVLAFVAWVLS